MTTSKLAEILNDAYQASGFSTLTDERLDEIIAERLADNGIEIDEDNDPTDAECVFVAQFVRSALRQWDAEFTVEEVK